MSALIAAGADGCRAGWICIARDLDTGVLADSCYSSARELIEQVPRPAVLTIDIPIGLAQSGARGCDVEARLILGIRRNSVFTAPLRPMLEARSWEEACSIRRSIEQKSISKQLWGILAKIRDVDAILRDNSEARRCVREVHPEVSFRAWSGAPMNHPKRKSAGRAERLQLVESHFGAGVLDEIRRRHRASAVASDDILDAFAALWTAERVLRHEAATLPACPPVDALGLAMEMVY